MPTYFCTAAIGLLNAAKKQTIAAAITGAHAEITGAPQYFAQVIFDEVLAGSHFMGAEPLAHEHVFVYGHIRAGRSAQDRQALVMRLIRDVAAAASLPAFSV